jgi:hypothetical protein
VKKVQAGYKVQTLSQFLGQPAPPAAPAIDFPKFDREMAQRNPFVYLGFMLQFCPPPPEEEALRAKFASIGIEAGKPFAAESLTPEQRGALVEGMRSAKTKIQKDVATLGRNENGWRIGAGGGDRAFYNGNWGKRAAIATAGIYANDEAEALYPMTRIDDAGQGLDGSKSNYTITFPQGQLPPVNAFWSVTMYDGRSQLLIKNAIDRYLINTPMLPDMKKNRDGSLTIYIQKDSPGAEKESNWLPAPNGPIYLVMRLYWPKEDATSGAWKPPAVKKAS